MGIFMTLCWIFFAEPFGACHNFSKHLKGGLKNSHWFGAESEHWRRAEGEQRNHCQFDYNITPIQKVNVVSQMSGCSFFSLILFSSFPHLSLFTPHPFLSLCYLPRISPHSEGLWWNPFKVVCVGLECHFPIRCLRNKACHIIRFAQLH